MKNIILFLLSLVAFAGVAEAQLYFVHGIYGPELQTVAANPVDVLMNGNCVLTGLNYQQVSAPISVGAGRYEVQIRVSNGNCTGGAFLTGSFDVAHNERLSVAIHLNEEGVPYLTKFSNDPRYTEALKARLVFRHTAGVEPFQIRMRRVSKGTASVFPSYLPIFRNGEQQAVELNPGTYSLTLYSTVGYRRKLATLGITVEADKLYGIYSIGSFKGKSFSQIVQILPTVPN